MMNRSLRCSPKQVSLLLTEISLLVAVIAMYLWLSVITNATERPSMKLVAIAPDGYGFAERDTGLAYIPFGTNYYDPQTGWAPKLWQQFNAEKVREHFRVMSEIGVNCARVFLTAGSFQPTAANIEEQALSKLDKLIEIARDSGIRLILTGPDHWEGQPAYWKPDRFAGEAALKALERLWGVVGKRYRGEPAIFAWDLLNEPHLPWFIEQWHPLWNAWLRSTYGNYKALKVAWSDELTETDRWGDVAVPQDRSDIGNPRLLDWQLFREHLADQWVRRRLRLFGGLIRLT